MKRSTYTLRRLLALVLVLVTVGSLFAGCSKKAADPTVPSEPNATTEQTVAPTTEATEAPTEEPTEAPTEPVETVPPVLMGTVNADNLNVRSEPYSTADILKRLAINTRVEILEQKIVDGVNWGRIAEGWINLNYVTIGVEFPGSDVDNTTDNTVVSNQGNIGSGSVTTNNTTEGVTTTGLNIRKDSNANSDSVGTYAKGTKVTILERSNGWGRTNKGWINLDYVDFSGKTTATSTGSSSSSGTNSATVSNGNTALLGYGTVVKTTSLAIRSGPGANYSQVSYVRMGERHSYYQTSTNGWVRFKKGWVNADYLELEYYVESGTEATVNVAELSVRAEPDYNSEKLHTYEKGDEIIILETKGTWGLVEYDNLGNQGWVDLDKVKLPTPVVSDYSVGIATITADALHIREKASASSEALGTYEKGDKVEVLEVKGNWGRTEDGWINLKYTKMETTYTTGDGTVTASKLNIRKEPDENSSKVGTLKNGDEVTILDTEGTWGKIEYKEDKFGWISLKYVKITNSTGSSSGSGSGSGSSSTSGTKYTVTVSRPDNGTLSVDKTSCAKGTTVTVTATPITDYKLDSIYVVDANDNVVSVSGNKFTMPEANVTVSATFIESYATSSVYNIDLTGAPGVTASATSDIAQGTKISLSISPDTDKILDELTIEDANGKAINPAADYSFTMPASNVVITATYKDAPAGTEYYDLTPAAGFTYGTMTPNITSAAKGTTITLTAEPDDGYKVHSITVLNVTTNQAVPLSGSGNNRTFIMPESDVTYNVHFTTIPYNVNVTNVTGGSAIANPPTGSYGSLIEVTAIADPDYVVTAIKVYGAGNKYYESDSAIFTEPYDTSATHYFAMPNESVTIVPVFERVPHTISGLTCSISAATSDITLSTTKAKAGETVRLTMAYPDTRFIVSTVTVTAGGSTFSASGSGNNWSFVMPAANVTAINVTYVRQYVVKAGTPAILYKEASSGSTTLATIPAGTTFTALSGSTGDWIQVNYSNKTGFVHNSYLN